MGGIILIFAFTHNWKNAGPYLLLGFFSIVGFAVSVFLHNMFEVIGGEGTILGIFAAVFFLIAVILCPAGLLVGIVGSILRTFKKVDKAKT